MATIKTKPTGLDVVNFIKGIEPAKKRADTLALKELFDSALNEEASLWNNNMIGYGTYHYKSEKKAGRRETGHLQVSHHVSKIFQSIL